MPEMTQSEQAAFAAMENEQAQPAPEPEPPEQEEPEAAAPPEGEPDEPAEGAEGADGEDQAKLAAERRVPYDAFHEERSRRQQLEAENRRLSEERARFDERLRVIQEMNQPAPPAEPDENVDPVGTITHLRREVAALKQSNQQWSEQLRQQTQMAQLEKAAKYDAAVFRSHTPDYADAYQFWGQSRGAELAAYGVSPAEISDRLEQEQLSITMDAFQRGVSPAETLYNVAKQRGFRGAAKGNGAAGNGDAAAERIQRVAAGQQRSQSLSGTGGGAAPVAMTVEKLLLMSKDEFREWTERNPRKSARLMGEEPPRRRA